MFDIHIPRRRRLAALLVAAPLAFAACGSSGTDVEAGNATNGGTLPPVAVETDSNSSSAVLPESGSRIEPADGAASSSMIAEVFEFVAGDVGDLPPESMGWAFLDSGAPSAEVVATLATALGVDDAHIVRDDEEPAEFGGAGSGQLWIGSDAQQSWSFSSYLVDLRTPCVAAPLPEDAAEPIDETRTTTLEALDCADEVATPENVPGEDEARTLGRDLLARIGEDPFAYHLEVFADDWSANVIAEPILDGARSQFGLSFNFGADGNLDYASGYFAEPTPVGPYPLVGLDVAIERLNEQWAGPRPAAADGEDVPVTTVTLTDYQPGFVTSWNPDDESTYLLPGFTFVGDNGMQVTVPAVTDEFLVDQTRGVAEPSVEPLPEPAAPPATIGESTDPGEPTG